jgi:hypothetical protein
MPCFTCVQCGAQFAERPAPPEHCPICQEERQYVRWAGQAWTTTDELRKTHSLRIADEAEAITGIGAEPEFAIRQRALLLQSPAGNVMWDCQAVVTDEGVAEIARRGGLAAIAISHPHYYTSMVEWSEALGGVPIYLHADDRQWVMRPSPLIRHWEGETLALNAEMTLIRCGGHFAGGTVLHWGAALGGRGALMSGDIVMVALDRDWLSFMYSYPNFIPLSRDKVETIAARLAPFRFDAIFGAWWDQVLRRDAKAALARSVARYVRAIDGEAGSKAAGIMLVRFRVADFDKWKSVYDTMAPVRQAHGFVGHSIFRDAADPDVVVVVNRASDLDRARAFGASSALREAMQRAGIEGKPEMSFLTGVEDGRA